MKAKKYKTLDEVELNRHIFDELIFKLIDVQGKLLKDSPETFNIALSCTIQNMLSRIYVNMVSCDAKSIHFYIANKTYNYTDKRQIIFKYDNVLSKCRMKKIKTLL